MHTSSYEVWVLLGSSILITGLATFQEARHNDQQVQLHVAYRWMHKRGGQARKEDVDAWLAQRRILHTIWHAAQVWIGHRGRAIHRPHGRRPGAWAA